MERTSLPGSVQRLAQRMLMLVQCTCSRDTCARDQFCLCDRFARVFILLVCSFRLCDRSVDVIFLSRDRSVRVLVLFE